MRALLLSAGFGTRLEPVTHHVPKCLVPIDGKVLLEYWLENLSLAGIEEFIVNTHYLHTMVEDFIATSKYKDKVICVYEKELLLTGGTLLKNKTLLDGDSIMVIHADNLSICDFKKFIARHESRPEYCEMTMMTFETDKPKQSGIVRLDENGVVQEFFEKVENPPSNLANGAVYIMEPTIFEYLESFGRDKIDLSLDVIPNFMKKIYTFHNDDYHKDIGTLQSYSMAQVDMLIRKNSFLSKK